MDLSALIESLRRGLEAIPPVVVVLGLLGGPTAALIGYRLIGVARRTPASPEPEAPRFWVCHACRSVNELRLSHCYRCATERDQIGDMEIVVEQPAPRPGPVNVPAGSPFAAVAAGVPQQPGVPVMIGRGAHDPPVAVGPGPGAGTVSSASDEEPVDLVGTAR